MTKVCTFLKLGLLTLGFAFLTLISNTGLSQEHTPWVHVEWAAGNYGKNLNGGTGGPLRRMRKHRPNQYKILFDTLDDLVATKGDHGVFYVNDLKASTAQWAEEALKLHAKEKGYKNVKFIALEGDLTSLPLPPSDTASLKNPDSDWFRRGPDIPGTNATSATVFQELANASKTGLFISTYFRDRFKKFAQAGGLNFEELGEGPHYYFPDGTIAKETTYVFQIFPDPNPPSIYSGRQVMRDGKIYCPLLLEYLL